MSLSAEDWARQLAYCETDKAVAVFHSPDLTLAWANEAFLKLLDEPYRSRGATGLPLKDFSPLNYVTQEKLLRAVGACGDPDSNEDYTFSVEDGITVYRWSAHSPCANEVIAVIEVEHRVPSLVERKRALALLGS